MVYDPRPQRTAQVIEHVRCARAALDEFQDGIDPSGNFKQPLYQAAALKIACEELSRAIAILEVTRWDGPQK